MQLRTFPRRRIEGCKMRKLTQAVESAASLSCGMPDRGTPGGGGASLRPSSLRHEFPVSGKNSGKVRPHGPAFTGWFRGKPYPDQIPANSVTSALSPEQGINREWMSEALRQFGTKNGRADCAVPDPHFNWHHHKGAVIARRPLHPHSSLSGRC